MNRLAPALSLLLAGPALAQAPVGDGPLTTWGDLRWIGSALSDFPVDAEGTTVGQSAWVDQRIRLGAAGDYSVWGWETEWDLLTGHLAGDTWDIPGTVDDRQRWKHDALTLDGVAPRKALVHGVVGDTRLELGLNTSHWGLGMVAHDGDHEPLFGRTDFGDRVLRLRSTWMPPQGQRRRGNWALVAAADLVVDDDTATLMEDDRAGQAILSAVHTRAGGATYGVYTVFRYQHELGPDRTLAAAVIDGYADVPLALGDWALDLAAEGAFIGGRTDRATTYSSPESIGIAQLGLVGHATLTEPGDRVLGHLVAGWASPDADGDDGTTHSFTFDRDFDAGLVLFDQVLGSVDAATHVHLTDPQRVHEPPDGVEALVREGAIHDAAFLQPVLQGKPVDWLDLRAGVLAAWATAPAANPFYSFRAGGSPRNQHDVAPGGRYLGTEIDWGVTVGRPIAWGVEPEPSFEIQGGHLLVGPALQGSGPSVIHHVLGTARVRW